MMKLDVRFKDEDGNLVNIEDSGDYEAAMDLAR
jgi:hypothetical protein